MTNKFLANSKKKKNDESYKNEFIQRITKAFESQP